MRSEPSTILLQPIRPGWIEADVARVDGSCIPKRRIEQRALRASLGRSTGLVEAKEMDTDIEGRNVAVARMPSLRSRRVRLNRAGIPSPRRERAPEGRRWLCPRGRKPRLDNPTLGKIRAKGREGSICQAGTAAEPPFPSYQRHTSVAARSDQSGLGDPQDWRIFSSGVISSSRPSAGSPPRRFRRESAARRPTSLWPLATVVKGGMAMTASSISS